MQPAKVHTYEYGDYLRLEGDSATRHEFVDGEIYAMAGGTPEHAALGATVTALIRSQLPAGCRTYSSDLRVRIAAAKATVYPDGSVICGQPMIAIDDSMAVTNPVLVVEVTSQSTEAWDRTGKLDLYAQLPSVKEVLLVSHAIHHLELHRRPETGWVKHTALAHGSIELTSIDGRLEVDRVYADLA
jgi:Uma2 family endonuclease